MSAAEKFIKLGYKASISDAFAALDEIGAASIKIIARDANDEPLSALIVVKGRQETAEIVDAFDKIEESWHDDEKVTPMIDPPAAYCEGGSAAADGKFETANPYPPDSEQFQLWIDGYIAVSNPDDED